MKELTSFVSARVTDAPALGGTKMYQVKISCKGKSKSMYKTKDDFKNVINMFKLVGAMAARKSDVDVCEVCASCSSMTTARCCDEESLNCFLVTVLETLRKTPREAVEECSTHRGVMQILMDFLSISKGKYFCHEPEADPAATELEASSLVQENERDHPIAHCSLHRSLSEQFAAFDSVC